MANYGVLRQVESLVKDAEQLKSQIGKAQQDVKNIRHDGQNTNDAINTSLSENVIQAKALREALVSGQTMWQEVEHILSDLIKLEQSCGQRLQARDEQPHWLTTITNRELPPLPKLVPHAELEEQFREADEKVWEARLLSATLSSKAHPVWDELASEVVLFEEVFERAEALIEQISETPTPPIKEFDSQLGTNRQQEQQNLPLPAPP